MGGLLHEVVFAVDGTDYLGADVVLAAKRSGEWSRLRAQVREGLACLRRLADLDAELSSAEVESAAQEFRYERDLISGQEMEAWLERWALTLDAWTDFLQRSVVRRASPADLADLVTRYPVDPAEVDGCLRAEAIASGRFEAWARDLASRTAAWARAREESWLPEGETAAWACRLERIDAGFRRFREEVLNPAALQKHVGAHQLDWVRIDYRCVAFSSLSAAREAALCVRDDGVALDEVAVKAKIVVEDARRYLDDLDPELCPHVVSAQPGDLVGPVAHGDGFALLLVYGKTLPSLADADTRQRAEVSLLRTALEQESRQRVRWRMEIKP